MAFPTVINSLAWDGNSSVKVLSVIAFIEYLLSVLLKSLCVRMSGKVFNWELKVFGEAIKKENRNGEQD